MARRPDLNSEFAQKLLGDIRRRKERLGYSSSGQQSSNSSTSFNAEANSRKSFRGAQQTTKNNFHAQSSSNKGLPSPQRKTKQPTLNASSQEIVPYRKERSPSMDNADVSMALALALSNTGKLQNIEVLSRTKVGTEFVTHRGSIHFSGKNSHFLSNGMGSNRNEFLFLPNFGVKKLSEMFSSYSGSRKQRSSLAMELEESLNMLIMLQDASDYMGGSNKNQVLLLKDKEENEDSFKSKSSKQTKFNSDKKSLSSYQRPVNSSRSATSKKENHLSEKTSSSSFMNSNHSNSTRGNSDSKLRIPSVIARLMGLEDLPEPVKPKVEIKEVEPQGKEEKREINIKRSSSTEKDTSAKCHVEVREETRLERITRTYIDSKKGIFENCETNAQNIPKKTDEKVHIIRNLKKKEKPKHEVLKQKTVVASKKVQKVQCMDKESMKKQFIGNSLHGKVVRGNSINKKKEVDGNMLKAKSKKVLDNGYKIGEKHVERIKSSIESGKEKGRETEIKIADLEENDMRTDKNRSIVVLDQSSEESKKALENGYKIEEKHVEKNKTSMELGKEKGRETVTKIADFEENDMRTDEKRRSIVILDQSSNEEKNYNERAGINPGAGEEQKISVSKEELQLSGPEEKKTDSCNCTKGSTDLHYEDSLTENQILLREMLLNDSEFVDLCQALFALEVNTVKVEKFTKTPLEKANNIPLLHTAHEIIKRKASRLDICEKFKIQSLNSLIRELDSDLRSLEYGRKSENFDFQRIIEREIRDGNPDASCMWEFGWNPKFIAPFEKSEVVKELEKHLTSGLITELTRDLVDEMILV
ncbi:Auxin-responsive protein [Rhynchospora pubera]|uniref:Auxin-responsive protein n=1 Tax=Rhynchospora pubera TaxID=906938 RepID=A0AAV8G9D8_9POAL|nr:Auxin-responsive protein [Rhynchospora pubera]